MPTTNYWGEPIDTYTVYVLELSDGHYYVGITKKHIADRFKQHASSASNGSAYTRLHKPQRILASHDTGEASAAIAEEIETHVTRHLIRQHGHERVTGGAFTRKTTSQRRTQLLQAQPLYASTERIEQAIQALQAQIGTPKRGRGRPRLEQTGAHVITLRLTTEQKATWDMLGRVQWLRDQLEHIAGTT